MFRTYKMNYINENESWFFTLKTPKIVTFFLDNICLEMI